jgi:hypothetical protein
MIQASSNSKASAPLPSFLEVVHTMKFHQQQKTGKAECCPCA